MSSWIWAYLTGVVVMWLILMSTAAADKWAANHAIKSESYLILLMIAVALTWPWQLLVVIATVMKAKR